MLPRQFLKVSALRPYYPGGPFNAFATALHTLVGYAIHNGQRLLLGLHGYLIRFAPPAFVPDRRTRSRQVPSLSVVYLGLKHFTAPPGILLPSPGPKSTGIFCTLLG